MGQKLSDLKGYYSVMEERENEATSISNINEDTENTSDIHVTSNTIAIDSSTAACSTEQYCSNGNEIHVVDQVDDHFESIYNIGIEGFRIDEGNGNLIDSDVCACRAACTCLTKSEFGFPDECIVGGHRPLDEQNLHVTTNPKHGAVRTLTFVNGKRSRTKPLRSPKELPSSSKKKRNHWVLKFNCTRLKGNGSCSTVSVENDVPEPNVGCDSCICTGYRKTDDHHLAAGVIFKANSTVEQRSQDSSSESSDSINSTASALCTSATTSSEQLVDMSKFNPEDYPIEDCDERARLERAREIAEGVEPPPGFLPSGHIQISLDEFTAFFQSHLNFHPAAFSAFPHVDVSLSPAVPRAVHTQVDFIHCLVPDLLQITSCSFYWGKMDRYEAERLLEGRPEGTFLLRDSAQDEYLFSVSFRKYGRSLHARIEQWNHHFSFDSHDPGVFASPTVCGLIEHYKDPSCCMFFEPMLTIPLHRNFTFPLQHLCRAVVCSRATYDGVNQLNLPKSLKNYLKEYHYKQRVRVRRLDMEQ